MNEELIKRIDEELKHEYWDDATTKVLQDCRAALSQRVRYVPMTEDELSEVYFSAEQDELDGFAAIQSEVIRRAGLEVKE